MASGVTAAAVAEAAVSGTEELPKAIVRRLVKAKLCRLQQERGGPDHSRDIILNRDALLGLGEGARIFIQYLASTANDVCHDHHRQTVNASDVLKAVEELEFTEYLDPLRMLLQDLQKYGQSRPPKKRFNLKKEMREEEEEEDVDDDDNGDGANDNEDGAEDDSVVVIGEPGQS